MSDNKENDNEKRKKEKEQKEKRKGKGWKKVSKRKKTAERRMKK